MPRGIYKRTKEHKRNLGRALSKALKGHTVSVETREKMRKARLGKSSGMKGKTVSRETKEKISQANLIKFKTDIKQRYINGEKIENIAKDEGCRYHTIWNRLHRIGVSTAPKRESSYYYRIQAIQTIKSFGYSLNKKEFVHHIDGNPKNNNIMNLLVVSRKEHARIHIHLPHIIKKLYEITN